MGVRWKFKTKRLIVRLIVERERGYKFDGDDVDGETQAALDRGELVAFSATVEIVLRNDDDIVIGRDSLYGSVYERANVPEFWKAHRDSDSMNRNCTAFRKIRGENSCVAHYFPDMVREAIKQARDLLPKNRGC